MREYQPFYFHAEFTNTFHSCLNFVNVKYYGEAEFWLAAGKVILATGFILFTFFTMVGANPLRDIYGFRFWDREWIKFSSNTG
jgi:amino acid permease